MIILIFVLFIMIIYIYCPVITTVLLHPFLTVKNLIVDTFLFFRFKKWNVCKDYGYIDIYTGLFGKGKTLSAVNRVCNIYKRYNNKKVYNNGKWVIQTIHIISNVDLKNISYISLTDTEQIVNCHKSLPEQDIVIVLIDEASTQFNSRSYKTNLSSTLLNAMLTCRHHKFSMILTAQRYNQVDALIRQVSSSVIECSKYWRLQVQKKADAWDMENCNNVKMVKSKKSCWFVINKDYNAYDTSAIVENIKRKQKNGELLTDEQVLTLQGSDNSSVYNVRHITHRYKKFIKK